MVPIIIDEINKCLENDMCIAALYMALTLPDICGKAEYPEANSGKRYIQWFDKYLGESEMPPIDLDDNMPYISGEVLYSLRNCLLHQGTPTVSNEKINSERNHTSRFTLFLEDKNKFDIYGDYSSGSFYINKPDQTMNTTYSASIRRICLILSRVAQSYYEDNKDKFSFINISFVDRRNEKMQ